MKPFFIIIAVWLSQAAQGQDTTFRAAKNWRLYDISAGNVFKYSTDTLRNFHYYTLDNDSMRRYMASLSVLLPESLPHWMGARVATYEMDGVVRKIEISVYGGFFYDETSKRHFQLPEELIDPWQSYVQHRFMGNQNQ
jgi:hypothetical protein